MKKEIYFIAAILLLELGVAAQSSKVKFRSINQAGMAGGESKPGYLLQTINGLSYKTFSAGVGVGIDGYYLRTIPLFLDVRKSFGSKKFQPFLYADGGANLPWKKADTDHPFIYDGRYSMGVYLDAGAGYSLKIKKVGALLLSLGYTSKTVNEESYYYFALVDPPPPYTPETNNVYYRYAFSRFTMKVGLSF